MRITGAVLEEIGRPRPYTGSTPLRVAEVDLAPPGPGEVLVRVEAAGLCHSDLSVIDGNRRRPVPMLLGHEAAGIVEQLGPEVDTLDVGHRVVLTFLPRCGECAGCLTDGARPCIAGSASNAAGELLRGGRRLSREGAPVHHHLGVSGFATHAVVDAHSVVAVPEDVPAQVAALLGCAVLTGGGAVLNVGRPMAGDTVAVVGLGGVGMAAVLTALAVDGVEVVAVDVSPTRRSAALDLGAHSALSPEQVADRPGLARVVIEAAGSVPALETAVLATAAGGQTITVGLPSPDARISLSPTALVAEGRSLVGSYLGSSVPSRDIPVYVELWRSGRLPLERLLDEPLDLARINEGFDRLADGVGIRQVIVL